MLRKLGLALCYGIAIVYILSIFLPAFYCYSHGCRGPGELDAFMPAFAFTPLGAIAVAFSLAQAIQRIKKGQSTWLFWPLALIFSLILLGVIALIAAIIIHTALHRR